MEEKSNPWKWEGYIWRKYIGIRKKAALEHMKGDEAHFMWSERSQEWLTQQEVLINIRIIQQ